VPLTAVFDEARGNLQDSDPLWPGWGRCVSIICWCGIAGEYENEKKLKVMRILQSAWCQNWITSCQRVSYTQDESCYVKLNAAGVFPSLELCNNSVLCWLFVNSDESRYTTADIAWLAAIYRTLVEGKDVSWCFFQIIPGIIHEIHTNNGVILYG
jgi:hypothetical protein